MAKASTIRSSKCIRKASTRGAAGISQARPGRRRHMAARDAVRLVEPVYKSQSLDGGSRWGHACTHASTDGIRRRRCRGVAIENLCVLARYQLNGTDNREIIGMSED